MAVGVKKKRKIKKKGWKNIIYIKNLDYLYYVIRVGLGWVNFKNFNQYWIYNIYFLDFLTYYYL
jgi:hypothetical protein